MDIVSLYWTCHSKNFDQLTTYLKDTQTKNSKNLIDLIINTHYNTFLNLYSDFKDDIEPVNSTIPNGKGLGKRIPYLGWYWRNLDFANKDITIGKIGSFIGFMATNKWDHPERKLTLDESNQIIKIIDEAFIESQQGGNLNEIYRSTVAVLENIWPLVQTFEV